jgi:hypothetical protein
VFSFVLWIPAALRNVPLCLAVVSEGRRHDGFSVLEQQESHMADDWRRDDRERFRRDPYSRDRAYGRGTDYEGDGTIARRGFGNDSSGYEGRGSHVSERDRGYMGSTERYRGDRGDRPYWTEDRFGGSDYERNLSQRRGPEDYEEPGYGDWGSPSLRRDRDTDYSRSSEDYRRRSGGYGRDHDTEAAYRELSDPGDGYVGRTRNHGFSGGRGHGFWREAVDEVKSWFGDDDRDTRYGRDRSESDWDRPSHRGRGPKGHTRSDERIREDVNDRLRRPAYRRVRDRRAGFEPRGDADRDREFPLREASRGGHRRERLRRHPRAEQPARPAADRRYDRHLDECRWHERNHNKCGRIYDRQLWNGRLKYPQSGHDHVSNSTGEASRSPWTPLRLASGLVGAGSCQSAPCWCDQAPHQCLYCKPEAQTDGMADHFRRETMEAEREGHVEVIPRRCQQPVFPTLI